MSEEKRIIGLRDWSETNQRFRDIKEEVVESFLFKGRATSIVDYFISEVRRLRGVKRLWLRVAKDNLKSCERMEKQIEELRAELKKKQTYMNANFPIMEKMRKVNELEAENTRMKEELQSEHGIRKGLETQVTSLGLEISRLTQQLENIMNSRTGAK